MDSTVIASTFFLTMLMLIGLVFFIRASTKDRTQVVTLSSAQSGDQLLAALKQYFIDRAYQVDAVDPAKNKVVLSGQVRPSVFLATLLSLMAGVGSLCLGLVLSMTLPDVPYLWAAFLWLIPGATWFYWKKAGRQEEVSFALDEAKQPPTGSWLTVRAHRDELESLQQTLNLTVEDYIAIE
jgi:hypothetical protein